MSRTALVLLCSLLSVPAALATPTTSWHDAMPAADLARDQRLVARVEAAYDSARGGYVARGGVPSETAVMMALSNAEAGLGPEWASRARVTVSWLDALVDPQTGGYYDRMPDDEGARDLVDKSTVANARRLEMLIAAWRATGDARYRERAASLVDFAYRVLADPRGGFVVAQVGDREPLPEPNGIMLEAWLEWATVTSDPRVRDFALKSIDRTWQTGWVDGAGLIRTGVFGETHSVPRLVDQAEMGRALVLAARLGGRAADRDRAIRLGELLLTRFEDTEKGGFRTQAAPARDGGVKKAGRDEDENARAVWFLNELSRLTGDTRYRDAAARAVRAFDERIDKMGFEAADWALATRAAWADDLPDAPAWRAVAEDTHREPPRSRTYRTHRR